MQDVNMIAGLIRGMKDLREFSCVVGELSCFDVRKLICSAQKPQLRAFTFHGPKEKTLLNAHYLHYRRKLMQSARLHRSYFHKSYFGKFILEFAELAEESSEELMGKKYKKDFGSEYEEWSPDYDSWIDYELSHGYSEPE